MLAHPNAVTTKSPKITHVDFFLAMVCILLFLLLNQGLVEDTRKSVDSQEKTLEHLEKK